jgi:GAF domain-containing protein
MDEDLAAALDALRSAALAGTPGLVRDDPHTALLQSIVDAAVTLFEAKAASIALFERAPDRLEFRVAAGPQGAGVVGLAIAPTKGLAGYVFSTGEAIALSDVTSDPRFDRATAQRTGYVPRSIAAVPLGDEDRPLGVLQVLDRHGSGTFTLPDMTRLGTFAAQATAALDAARVARDGEALLRAVLVAGPSPDARSGHSGDAGDALARALAALDGDDAPFWRLVDRLVRVRRLSDAELGLVIDLLGVVSPAPPTPASYRLRSLRRPAR